MDIQGACHCGRITYEARIDPARVVLCHCTDCQTFSSAPYRASVPVRPENFQLSGEPKSYVKTAASGNAIVQAFCGGCGTPLYSHRRNDPPYLNLRLGAVKQRAELPPRLQGFCESAMPWAFDITQVPRPGSSSKT
ncbi:MAG: GFA family protein [Alphaproteobacteria bacterium]|nr:GFA family protein [Alphaproteobacteria bacterium]